jgi:hypothetical protein
MARAFGHGSFRGFFRVPKIREAALVETQNFLGIKSSPISTILPERQLHQK